MNVAPKFNQAQAIEPSAYDLAHTTSPTTLYKAPGLTVLTIDTGSDAGRQAMLDMIRAHRRIDALAHPLARIRSALDSHRNTQRDRRLGHMAGYFATVAESRAFVRQRVAEARAAAAGYDRKAVRP